MAVFRGTDRIRNITAALRQSFRRVRSKRLKGMTVVEKTTQTHLTYYQKNDRRPLIAAVLVLFVSIAAAVGGQQYIQAHSMDYYKVLVDGKPVGEISDRQKVEQLLQSISSQLNRADTPVQYAIDEGQVTYEALSAYRKQTDDESTLKLIAGALQTHPVGVQLVVDGMAVGIVRDQKTADALLERVKHKYLPANSKAEPAIKSLSFRAESMNAADSKPDHRVTSVNFEEQVKTRTVSLHNRQLSDPEDLYRKLTTREPVSQTESDPPVLNVKSVEQVTEIEVIEPKIIYKTSDELKLGKSKVIQEGTDGQQQVTYRLLKRNGYLIEETIVTHKVLKAASPTIILKGTKVVQGEGTGTFSWPVVGARITSYMGERWGRMHKGIDLVGDSSILAADNGVIEFAGYKGAMGKAIIIDHNNGFKTVYGHMKSINVKEGQVVEKGEVIGVMGSTGRSTGTHLHFEVHFNDKVKNPTSYLS
ncbi:M23 family metallopeptidase [Cohnella kolymensis]|uniref:M23 family metallopeptidase n=1 Tax=Cohnella kolymensis TaxID=1590652 RepID=UPI0006970A9F|nr:M23 family metallopeptidase [Cohnella kolymensis]